MKRKRKSPTKRVYAWLPLAIGITLIFGIIFFVVRQTTRGAANDPQIQMAGDIAHDLSAGMSPAKVKPTQKVDIRESLSPFVIVYDDLGRVLASSGELDGKTPVLPAGVLDYTREHVQDRITWEPAPGVRSAIVVMRYTNGTPGFVLVGRSIREVENRTQILLFQLAAAWMVSLGVSYLLRR